MNSIQDILKYITNFLTFWVIISPFERGLRIRFGKNVKILTEGIHLKIPIFDAVYIQTIRSRNISSGIQTVSTKDGITISLGSIVQYNINDIYKLYNTLYHPEMTITNLVMGEISNYISDNIISDCSPQKIQDKISAKLKNTKYGIEFEFVNITTYAIVKTFRLIQDVSWINEGYNLNQKI